MDDTLNKEILLITLEECLAYVFEVTSDHPARRRRGFRDEHYKARYFWIVARALYQSGIIDAAEGSGLAKTFLEKFENPKTP